MPDDLVCLKIISRASCSLRTLFFLPFSCFLLKSGEWESSGYEHKPPRFSAPVTEAWSTQHRVFDWSLSVWPPCLKFCVCKQGWSRKLKPKAGRIRSSLCWHLTSLGGRHPQPVGVLPHTGCVSLQEHTVCVRLFVCGCKCGTHWFTRAFHYWKPDVLLVLECHSQVSQVLSLQRGPKSRFEFSMWYTMRSCLVCEAVSNRVRLSCPEFDVFLCLPIFAHR